MRNILLALCLPSTPNLKSIYLLYLTVDDDVPRRVGDGRHVLRGSAGESSYLEWGRATLAVPAEGLRSIAALLPMKPFCYVWEFWGGQVCGWSVRSRLPSLVRVLKHVAADEFACRSSLGPGSEDSNGAWTQATAHPSMGIRL
jgi:hypothetical protein